MKPNLFVNIVKYNKHYIVKYNKLILSFLLIYDLCFSYVSLFLRKNIFFSWPQRVAVSVTGGLP